MKTPLSISVIYWVVSAVYWVIIIVFILLMIQYMYVWDLIDYALMSNIKLPVDPKLIDLQSMVLNESVTPVKVNSVIAEVDYAHLDKYFLGIYNGGTLILVGILFFWWTNIRQFMSNVRRNVIFSAANVKYIKTAAYGMFVVWFISLLLHIYHSWYFDLLNPITIDFIDLFFDNYFVAGMAILALAYVFETGVKLQEEKNLTI